jgi:hypothetical protein
MPDTLAGFAEGICVWSTGASRPGYNEPKLGFGDRCAVGVTGPCSGQGLPGYTDPPPILQKTGPGANPGPAFARLV